MQSGRCQASSFSFIRVLFFLSVLSWFVSPVIAGLFAVLLFLLVERLVNQQVSLLTTTTAKKQEQKRQKNNFPCCLYRELKFSRQKLRAFGHQVNVFKVHGHILPASVAT